MTHWSDSGIPLTEDHDDAEIIWGDPPAAAIEEGLQRLIARLYAELRHHPTVADIDEQTSAPQRRRRSSRPSPTRPTSSARTSGVTPPALRRRPG